MTITVQILTAVKNKPGITSTELMHKVGKPSTYGSGYVRGLIKQNLIEVPTTNPRTFSITPKGVKYIELHASTEDKVTNVNVSKQPEIKPEEKIEIPQEVKPSSLDHAIEELAGALVARVSSVVELKVNDLVGELVTRQVTASIEKLAAGLNATPATPKATTPLPRILIVGLLDSQSAHVKREFDRVFDLRFVGSNESTDKLKSNAAQADVVYVMGDFVSHSTNDLIRRVGAVPHVLHGGLTKLRDTLTSLYVEKHDEAK